MNSDIEVDLNDGEIKFLSKPQLDIKVSLIDTGLNTMTGGRLKKIYPYVSNKDNIFEASNTYLKLINKNFKHNNFK